jgi:hypothetical protein
MFCAARWLKYPQGRRQRTRSLIDSLHRHTPAPVRCALTDAVHTLHPWWMVALSWAAGGRDCVHWKGASAHAPGNRLRAGHIGPVPMTPPADTAESGIQPLAGCDSRGLPHRAARTSSAQVPGVGRRARCAPRLIEPYVSISVAVLPHCGVSIVRMEYAPCSASCVFIHWT